MSCQPVYAYTHIYIHIYYSVYMFIANMDWNDSRRQEHDAHMACHTVYTYIHTYIHTYLLMYIYTACICIQRECISMNLGVERTMIIWHATLYIYVHTYIYIYMCVVYMYIARTYQYESRCQKNDDNMARHSGHKYKYMCVYINTYINKCIQI